MKVLQINSVCGIGSTGRIATDIHSMLTNEGHASYVAYGRSNPVNCDNTIKIGTKYDNYSHVALTRFFDKHGFGSRKATKELIKRIETLNPDIIHLHNIHGYYIHIEILFQYLKKVNKPVIWTLHDCWAFTGHCTHFDYIKCDKWKTGCYNCPQQKAYPTSVILDNSNNNYSSKQEMFTGVEKMIIVTPSNWLAGLVKQSFLGEYPVKVINNGIDLEVFKPSRSDFKKVNKITSNLVILGVANGWSERKGLNFFIELSQKIKQDEKIIMVGLTERQRKTLPNNIIGISRTNNVKELAMLYSVADIFINPTLEDNFPTTNLESLACGTPVITFNTGGSIESIDSTTGFVVSKGSIAQVIDSMQVVKEKRKSFYSERCRQRCTQLYDKEERYMEYLELYTKLVLA